MLPTYKLITILKYIHFMTRVNNKDKEFSLFIRQYFSFLSGDVQFLGAILIEIVKLNEVKRFFLFEKKHHINIKHNMYLWAAKISQGSFL